MLTVESLTRRFEQVFERRQATMLADTFKEAYDGLVRQSDFTELKEIVKDLGAAQQRTEAKIADLTDKMGDLTGKVDDLTKKMDDLTGKVSSLAEAQQQTEIALTKLAGSIENLAQEVGGLSRGMSYAMENEAYRLLPAFLRAHYAIELESRLIRTTLNQEELDLFAVGSRHGRPIVIVGECKLQLDERRNNRRAAERLFTQIAGKAEAIQEIYPQSEIIPLLITHYARPVILEEAKNRGVIVVQSFEWES